MFFSKKRMWDDGLRKYTCQRRRLLQENSLALSAEVGTTMFDPLLKEANA